MSANERQVGGEHYKSGIQHWDFVASRGMSYLGGQITKYAMRWRRKNGAEDIEKAVHFLEKLIEVTENPPLPVSVEEFLQGNLMLDADEAAVMLHVSAFETSNEVAHLRAAKIHLERLLLAARGPAG